MKKLEIVEYIKSEIIEQLEFAVDVFERETNVSFDYDKYKEFINKQANSTSLTKKISKELTTVPRRQWKLVEDRDYFFGEYCNSLDLDIIIYELNSKNVDVYSLWNLRKFVDVLNNLVDEYVDSIGGKFDLFNDLAG